MIFHNNDILNNGQLYKFKAEPVDPYDAFRGKYIHLNFELSSIYLKKKVENSSNIYAVLATDSKGFAKITKVTPVEPKHGDYVKVTLSPSSEYDSKIQVWINFPFDRYYMNEYKAPEAEKTYNSSIRDSSKNVYAVVAVKNGEAIIKDVMIDGISIQEYVSKRK